MPNTTDESGKSFWLPSTIPTKTESWDATQAAKTYLTPDGTVRRHPRWTYATGSAYVDTDYLYNNEGWKEVLDDAIPSTTETQILTKNPSDEWSDVDTKTVRVTYTVTDMTAEEVEEHKANKWKNVRDIRDSFLVDTDWIVTSAQEQGRTLSSEFIAWRNSMRDLPETIGDGILDFDPQNNEYWRNSTEEGISISKTALTLPTNFYA